jgi:hypothetical protein
MFGKIVSRPRTTCNEVFAPNISTRTRKAEGLPGLPEVMGGLFAWNKGESVLKRRHDEFTKSNRSTGLRRIARCAGRCCLEKGWHFSSAAIRQPTFIRLIQFLRRPFGLVRKLSFCRMRTNRDQLPQLRNARRKCLMSYTFT